MTIQSTPTAPTPMTANEKLTLILSGIGLVIAMVSAVAAVLAWWHGKRAADAGVKAADAAVKATEVSKEIARRQGVVELHHAWAGVSTLHREQDRRIGEDERKAVNALALTSALWNHDVIHREILFQSYSDSFNELFSILDGFHTPAPGFTRPPRDYLTPEVRKVRDEMHQIELSRVQQTRLP